MVTNVCFKTGALINHHFIVTQENFMIFPSFYITKAIALVVAKLGTATVRPEELLASLENDNRA